MNDSKMVGPWPLGKNAKLDELMLLVAITAATESGNGCDERVIEKHAKRAAKLWEEHQARAALEASSGVEDALRARDIAQAEVQAWVHVADCLEAHIMDRAAMNDPASPETYLAILRGEVERVKHTSEQICAARWADYKRHRARIEELEARLASLSEHQEGTNERQ